MTTNAKTIDLDFSRFQDIDVDEAQIVDGGWVQLAAAGVVAGVAAVGLAGVALGAGVAVGYYVNRKDCPDEPIMVPGT